MEDMIKNLAEQVYKDQSNNNMQREFESDESKLAYLIMTQRYKGRVASMLRATFVCLLLLLLLWVAVCVPKVSL